MDVLSHALWTNLVFKELPPEQRSFVVFFGVLPDFISFARIIGKGFLQKILHYTDKPLSTFPKFVFKLYDFTHSLVVWLGIYLFLKIFHLDWAAFVFLGWGFHIMLDIFTHSRHFFPTPILWPFSHFHFSGIAWANKWFMLFNYSVLTFLYLVFYF